MLTQDQFMHLSTINQRQYLCELYKQLNSEHAFDDILMIVNSDAELTAARILDMYTWLVELLAHSKNHLNETSQQHAKVAHEQAISQHNLDEQQAEELLHTYI